MLQGMMLGALFVALAAVTDSGLRPGGRPRRAGVDARAPAYVAWAGCLGGGVFIALGGFHRSDRITQHGRHRHQALKAG
jgi:hypothetical protein